MTKTLQGGQEGVDKPVSSPVVGAYLLRDEGERHMGEFEPAHEPRGAGLEAWLHHIFNVRLRRRPPRVCVLLSWPVLDAWWILPHLPSFRPAMTKLSTDCHVDGSALSLLTWLSSDPRKLAG